MSLTPPTKGKPADAPKAEKAAKAPKEPKSPREKKERAPKADYGFKKGATIKLTGKDQKYGGQRLEWFETFAAFEGKPVEEWIAARQGIKNGAGTLQSPRGWLRFYVQDGTVVLEGGEAPAPKKAKEPEAAQTEPTTETKAAG